MKKAQKDHFANLCVNSVSDNKKLWQIVKPLFSDKVKAETSITLLKNNEMIDYEIEIAKLINGHFKNIKTYNKRAKCSFHRNSLKAHSQV